MFIRPKKFPTMRSVLFLSIGLMLSVSALASSDAVHTGSSLPDHHDSTPTAKSTENNNILLETQTGTRRRLDRPETIIKKKEKPKHQEEEHNHEDDDKTHNEPATPERVRPEAISLPEQKAESTTKKGQCLSATSCATCKVVAQRLQNDEQEPYTCAWQFSQEGSEPDMQDKEMHVGDETYSQNNFTNYNPSIGLCVSIYKSYAENQPMAGGDMTCDNLDASRAPIIGAIRNYSDYDSPSGSSQSFAFLILLGIAMSAIYMKKKLIHPSGATPMGMNNLGGDLEMGRNAAVNRFAKERLVKSNIIFEFLLILHLMAEINLYLILFISKKTAVFLYQVHEKKNGDGMKMEFKIKCPHP